MAEPISTSGALAELILITESEEVETTDEDEAATKNRQGDK